MGPGQKHVLLRNVFEGPAQLKTALQQCTVVYVVFTDSSEKLNI